VDTLLTAPLRDECIGNILTIYGQAEGDGAIICGSLDNYESEYLLDVPIAISF